MTSLAQTFTYRKGSITDKDQLKHMGLITFGQYFNQLTPENEARLTASLSDEKKLLELIHMSEIFVCLDGDKIIGTAYFIPSGNPWDVFEAGWSYIRMVGVDPAYQGKGIAKALTQSCLEQAKKINEKIIALHTSEMMNAARHIYESVGFKILREIEPRMGKKYWLYTLNL